MPTDFKVGTFWFDTHGGMALREINYIKQFANNSMKSNAVPLDDFSIDGNDDFIPTKDR